MAQCARRRSEDGSSIGDVRKREKYYDQRRIIKLDSERIAQLLLFSIYATVMGILIFTVVDESMSGVVILIFGALVIIYLFYLQLGAGLASRPLRQNIPERNLMDELGSINPPPTQIKLGPVTLKELTPEQKKGAKMDNLPKYRPEFHYFLIDISINEGLI